MAPTNPLYIPAFHLVHYVLTPLDNSQWEVCPYFRMGRLHQ